MPEPGSPGGRKGPDRVEVIHFPKKSRVTRRRTLDVQGADPSETRTIEFRPDFDEPPSRPAPVKGRRDTPTEELPVVPEPNRRGRSARAKTTPKESRRKTTGESKKAKKRVTLEVDTDPALRYHVQKLDELLGAKSPAEPLRSMSRMELAEMSLFGHQLFESGRLEEARVVFEGLVGLDLADAFPHTMLGTVYLAMGRHDRAMALFEAALAIDPEDLAARVYQAELRINAGHIKPAISDLEKVIARGPPQDPFIERARRLIEIVQQGARRKR